MKPRKLICVSIPIMIIVMLLLTSCGNSVEQRAGRWQAISEFGEIAFLVDDTGTRVTDVWFRLECDPVEISYRGAIDDGDINIIDGEINEMNIIIPAVSNDPILDWALEFNRSGTGASGTLRIQGQEPCETELRATNLGPATIEVGDNASHLEFLTYEGISYEMSDYLDQVVIINYWASWSEPSVTEISELQRVWEEYGDQGALVLGINYLDSDADAKSFVQNSVITYPVGPYTYPDIVSGPFFDITGAPETYILDHNGNLVEILIGPSNYEDLSMIITEILENQ